VKKVINVTKTDIKRARRCINAGNLRSCCCPIALAAQRAFSDDTLKVSHVELVVKLRSIPIPMKAKDFICAFDNGERVSPIRFEVEA